jgi:hypothetical protein
MTSRFTRIIISGFIALFGLVGVATLQASPAYAVNCSATPNAPSCAVKDGTTAAGADNDTTCGDNGKQKCTLGLRIQQVVNVLLFIVGVISVIMIIIGGIRYVLSNGDSSQITGAKNTVLYAVIGLIVSLLAYAIIDFVVKQFS